MFDIGFSELLLFGVIALIVLGPEKLPQAARTAGQWYAKIRRTVSTLQSEIEAELDLAETRQQMQKELAKIRQTEAEMRREMAEMRGSMQEFESSQNQHLKTTHSAVADEEHDANNEDKSNNSDQSSHESATPKTFDYSYQQNDQSKVSDDNLKTDPNDIKDNSDQIAQIITTKPWENMWFRLGAYDKARRLPVAPYLPNYKADILLNSGLDSPLNNHLNKQSSANKQESK
ncbi:Sec-independent protein translocase protein TatB [Psychrobacter sp. DAB_AL43B]|uniref:Sec-independent protein translocase protein TatB n=1 Tax=Psychrobacter sp. DAB_AL43B TaxID=1028416 RepID=UPI0009A77D21|nr:Sec-independent protein translocase protein TatB [Psychrobacter sp. DAB_AL43B]SLJ85797.1 Twin-arginine translocation protein TatB [Psychrobacter sp. DAB_AL43B]